MQAAIITPRKVAFFIRVRFNGITSKDSEFFSYKKAFLKKYLNFLTFSVSARQRKRHAAKACLRHRQAGFGIQKHTVSPKDFRIGTLQKKARYPAHFQERAPEYWDFVD
ncbi:MAG: hypothetical protein J6Y77_01295 [Paludibacteraceae bacterium]|nr:hypothetical protein [Paludibacteraceae bacterium]